MNGNGKLRQVSIARSRLRLWWTTSAIPQPQHHQHQHGPRANISRTEAPAEHHNIVIGDSSGYIWNHPSNHPSKLIVHEMSKYINKSRMGPWPIRLLHPGRQIWAQTCPPQDSSSRNCVPTLMRNCNHCLSPCTRWETRCGKAVDKLDLFAGLMAILGTNQLTLAD